MLVIYTLVFVKILGLLCASMLLYLTLTQSNATVFFVCSFPQKQARALLLVATFTSIVSIRFQ
jgi:hypothetical protein